MTLGWAAKDASLAATPVETIRDRAGEAGILGTTRYWTPEIHSGAFNLPPYIAQHLPVAKYPIVEHTHPVMAGPELTYRHDVAAEDKDQRDAGGGNTAIGRDAGARMLHGHC